MGAAPIRTDAGKAQTSALLSLQLLWLSSNHSRGLLDFCVRRWYMESDSDHGLMVGIRQEQDITFSV